jgi:cysteine desulfurase
VHHFVHAFIYAQKNLQKFSEKIKSLQEYFENKIQKEIPEALITSQNEERSPHISHVAIPHIDSELLVIELDAKGVAVSSKSACKTDEKYDGEDITKRLYGEDYGAVRFSFGRWTTKSDLDQAILKTKKIIHKYKTI